MILLQHFREARHRTFNSRALSTGKRCLGNNRSCSQAWEIFGLSMEKESDFVHAAECYRKAWKLEFEASASVGFKLAFCLHRTKAIVECIDICEKVLQQYPDYPRIREEILRKAQIDLCA